MAEVSPAPRQPSTSCASPAPSAAPLRARRSAGRSRGAPPPPPRVTAPPPPPRARCAPTREARRGRERGGCGVGLVQRGAPAPSPADRLVQAPPRAAPAPSRAAAGRRTAPPPRRQPRRWATPWVWVVGANQLFSCTRPYLNPSQHSTSAPRVSRLFVPPQSGHRWHCLAARGSWLQVGRPPARAKAPGWCTRTAAARTADSAEDRAEELRQRAVHQRLTFTLPCADPWCPPRFRRFSDGRLRIRAAMTVANPSLACLPCSCPHPSCTPHPLRQPL